MPRPTAARALPCRDGRPRPSASGARAVRRSGARAPRPPRRDRTPPARPPRRAAVLGGARRRGRGSTAPDPRGARDAIRGRRTAARGPRPARRRPVVCRPPRRSAPRADPASSGSVAAGRRRRTRTPAHRTPRAARPRSRAAARLPGARRWRRVPTRGTRRRPPPRRPAHPPAPVAPGTRPSLDSIASSSSGPRSYDESRVRCGHDRFERSRDRHRGVLLAGDPRRRHRAEDGGERRDVPLAHPTRQRQPVLVEGADVRDRAEHRQHPGRHVGRWRRGPSPSSASRGSGTGRGTRRPRRARAAART